MSISPMMQHYLQTKEKYKDTILLYRLGDFYELFFEDADICSRELGLTLTGKACGLEKNAPMCGMPAKAVETYISKLINKGYKVAICEQLTQPQKGVKIVERDVVRVITAGTVIDSEMLDDKSQSFIASVFKEKNNIGISYIDITTGDFFMSQFTEYNVLDKLNDFLVMITPKEIICNKEMLDCSSTLFCVQNQTVPHFNLYSEESFLFETAKKILLNQVKTDSLTKLKCGNKQFAVQSSGALLAYLNETQKRSLYHINAVEFVMLNDYMQLDANTRRNLELDTTLRENKKRGSLFWLLDKTKTNMGARMLKSFLDKPLFDDKKINARLKGVEELIKNIIKRESLKELLAKVYDLERLTGKIAYGNLNPKDCLAIQASLQLVPKILDELSSFNSDIINGIKENLFDYNEITKLLFDAINENATVNLADGGFIKKGYNKELDEYDDISKTGKKWILELEANEKQSTGIKNLKINYNKIFGYFIEVTNSQKSLVPYRYTRKQTIVNAERYITDELKQIEDKILNAEEKKIVLAQELFKEIHAKLLEYIKKFQLTAKSLALLDALLSLASVAVEKNYVKPIINKNIDSIEIINGRHPVVETLLKNEEFVPNDTFLNTTDRKTMILTGPNMAGKSTYMRQVAIITLLAHIGSYVPAESAKISLTDRIFTRIGASDDLTVGQSTFMVEMLEVSNILKNATNNSLIILDEVGRGTSTFDGLSIAWSVMEYVSKSLNAKTLFATHFHELTELEGKLEGVKNYQVSVKEFNNQVIFLRKIVRGGANKSFGIEVAALAELPKEVIENAKRILHKLEENAINENIVSKLSEEDNLASKEKKQNINEIINILTDLNINSLTPLNAFDILVQLKNYLDKN